MNGLASRIGLIGLTSGCLSVWAFISACINRDDDSEYLPRMYKNKNCIVYTGSHDSDCTLTWCKNLDGDTLKRFEKECPRNHPSDVYNLIEFAFLSPANLAVIPLQDYLELENEEGRMNTPSTASGNWTWRVDPSYNNFDLIKKIKDLTTRTKRG